MGCLDKDLNVLNNSGFAVDGIKMISKVNAPQSEGVGDHADR